MANIFNSVPFNVPKRNRFNLSHSVKTTLNMGLLVPILCQDVIPSDRFKVSLQSLTRVAPMLAPAFSEISVQFHFFFVPNRIIWTSWEDFITGSHNGKKLPEDQLPEYPTWVMQAGDMRRLTDPTNFSDFDFQAPLCHGGLADNLGFQTYSDDQDPTLGQNPKYQIDQLPFRAYYKIYEDFFKDENLGPEDKDAIYRNSGPIPYHSDYDDFLHLRRRAWKKDYFTSALPFPQKGDDVLIPGTGSGPLPAPALPTGFLPLTSQDDSVGDFLTRVDGNNLDIYKRSAVWRPAESKQSFSDPVFGDVTVNTGNLSDVDSDGKLSAVNSFNYHKFGIDFGRLSSRALEEGMNEGTIRELRRAIAAQKFLERRAVGGSRYIEQNLAFFGARSSDGRLQRAQFLGGYKQPVVVSQLLQTSESTANSPLGTPAGNAVSAGSSYIFDKQFEEYGWIIGVMSIVPKADYLTGIPRKFLRRDVYDFYWPQFAHVGEQPIQNQELFYNADPSLNPSHPNDGTFGYTPRYAEYRFNNNRICGDFKGSLKFWTLGRDFENTPLLNNSFIECKPSNRIFAVQTDEYKHFWSDIYLNILAIRPIPKYAESL